MATNLYGPNDNFDLQRRPVLPAMIRKVDDARHKGDPAVEVWGTGAPRRELLHVDDLADACLFLLDHATSAEPINVGTGSDVTIAELAEAVRRVVGFSGTIEYDASKPDGTPRKLLDVSRIHSLGWRSSIALEEGIASPYEGFLE